MMIPLIRLAEVWHVGTMDRERVGANSGGSSLEGHSLSVSLCPEAWTEIARLGGNATFRLDRPDGLFMNVHAALGDPDLRDEMLRFAVENDLVVPTTLWRFWETDEVEEWRWSTAASRDEAWEEIACAHCLDPDDDEALGDLEAPEGYRLVEEIASYRATDALRTLVGMRLPDGEDATDAAAVAFAMTALPDLGLPVDGVWWRETFDPDALSAPRGCIFRGAASNWRAVRTAAPDDEELLDAMPDTGFEEIPSGPGIGR
jgi:hypothetical protein